MSQFEEFAELLERCCFNSWRSAIGKDNEPLISEISSILFTKEEAYDGWRFSFALRRFGKWVQVERTIEPIEYNPYDPPAFDEPNYLKHNMSPQNTASQLGTEILLAVAEKLGARDAIR